MNETSAARVGNDVGKHPGNPMKLVAALVALLSAVCSCYAQDRPEAVIPSSRHTLSETCVEVEIGNEKAPSLGCLNRRLKQQVDRVAPSLNAPPIDARSQDIRVGIANTVAVQLSVAQRSRSGLNRPLLTLWQSIVEACRRGFGATGMIYRSALTF
jgi:hypothetical protein